jgi:serine/threonine-protein kinase
MRSDTTCPVHEGDVLAGKYRVERVLGMGGMGVVVAARHIQLDERVALKFLLPQFVENREVVARFAREGRAAAKIRSEHVARVTDVGMLETGSPYLVMECLEGTDLSALVARQGPLAEADAVEYVLQACEALAEAHALGIVHRDLKPANLFLTRRADGSAAAKVLDFGISKVTSPGGGGQSDTGMTQTTSSLGSPIYMSPEQMTSAKSVDARSDIWGLGVVLFELLSGDVPFQGESFAHLCVLIATAAPLSLRSLRPRVSLGLEAVILRCLQKDRADRFTDVAELAAALGPFGPPRASVSVERAERILRSTRRAVDSWARLPCTPMSPMAATAGSWVTTSTASRRSLRARWILTCLVGLVCVLALVAGSMFARSRVGTKAVAAPVGLVQDSPALAAVTVTSAPTPTVVSIPAATVEAPSSSPIRIAPPPAAAILPSQDPKPRAPSSSASARAAAPSAAAAPAIASNAAVVKPPSSPFDIRK